MIKKTIKLLRHLLQQILKLYLFDNISAKKHKKTHHLLSSAFFTVARLVKLN